MSGFEDLCNELGTKTLSQLENNAAPMTPMAPMEATAIDVLGLLLVIGLVSPSADYSIWKSAYEHHSHNAEWTGPVSH